VEEGHSRTRVIPEEAHVEMVQMTEEYKELKKARRRMKELFDQVLSEIDQISEIRCEEGTKRFEQQVSEIRRSRTQAKEGVQR
jgi:metal-dependent amidase/aminoacylase/carboxypeptidase family protein